jgi:hypothetical protein
MNSGSGEKGGSDLRSEYERYSGFAELAALLILVGLAVEIAAVFILHKPWPENVLSVASTALIAVGVWGEIILEKRAKNAGDGLVAQAEERAADANAKALEAQAELERLKAPRFLSEEQRARITEKMSTFAGQEFTGAVAMGASDAWTLWRLIANVLQGAGWVRVKPSGQSFGDPPAAIPIATTRGVMIMAPVGGSSTPEITKRSRALAEALSVEGIEAIWWPMMPTNSTAIRIEIGPKT